MIIINHAATLNYENQKSVTTNYEAFKGAYEMLNNKKYYNSKDNSEIEASYDFNTTDLYGNIIQSNETALLVLKSMPWLLFGDLLEASNIKLFNLESSWVVLKKFLTIFNLLK
ncbi:hypothetical protein QTP88_018842 [Uroleucon formosanum]